MRLAGSPGMAREVRLEKNGDSIHGLRAEYFAATNAFDQALALPPVTSFLAQGLAYRSLRYFYLLQLEDALSACNELPGVFAGPAAGLLLGLSACAGDRERVLQLADRSSGAKGFSTMAPRVTPNGASWSESAQ
jgi:hypothetical protein